jgi:hypothetical protein
MDPQYHVQVDDPSENTGKEMRRVLYEEESYSKQKYMK